MKFLVTSCVVLFCLSCIAQANPWSMVYLTDKRSEHHDEPKASFVGGGLMTDSCRGEVEFKSELSHDSRYGRASILTKLEYRVTLSDGEQKEFIGGWHWKATASFMSELNFDEDETWGHLGDEDGWQEECEERSTDVSQCDRMFGYNRYAELAADRIKPNNGILTGRGDPLNPAYYEITFNSTTEDGCTQKWTDRLVFQYHSSP